ncbi:hypothetical protein HNP46_006534 [Pseudomonas nitritireducens]|uniref:Uncharacterized protein n=1 Tax=Pseudomonas nitroreducens TaxID=46680 RepID=A0A7W7P5F0_PSENT|nr:hypothetical protein [Pseudomonas nitritireducens]MBB4867620.1 hypothetical protein [Pseudomonas nitritireducens]
MPFVRTTLSTFFAILEGAINGGFYFILGALIGSGISDFQALRDFLLLTPAAEVQSSIALMVTVGGILGGFMRAMTLCVNDREIVVCSPAIATQLSSTGMHSQGREMAIREASEFKRIPNTGEMWALRDLMAEIEKGGLEGSQILDRKIFKVLGHRFDGSPSVNRFEAEALAKFRLGGIESNLRWDVDVQQDDDLWMATLRVGRNAESAFHSVCTAKASTQALAVLLTILHRETLAYSL